MVKKQWAKLKHRMHFMKYNHYKLGVINNDKCHIKQKHP
jgi:hypothetical protein